MRLSHPELDTARAKGSVWDLAQLVRFYFPDGFSVQRANFILMTLLVSLLMEKVQINELVMRECADESC